MLAWRQLCPVPVLVAARQGCISASWATVESRPSLSHVCIVLL